MNRDIVRRYANNTILTKAAIPYPVETVHNAAVVKHDDEYVMLFGRTSALVGRSLVWHAAQTDSSSRLIRSPF